LITELAQTSKQINLQISEKENWPVYWPSTKTPPEEHCQAQSVMYFFCVLFFVSANDVAND